MFDMAERHGRVPCRAISDPHFSFIRLLRNPGAGSAAVADAEKIDDFQIVGTIANGNASKVLEVRDVGGQSYAMKLMLPDAFKNPEQVAVLKHEAKVGQAIEHPNFIRTFKFVKTKTHCYMLMELFRCPNLKQTLQVEPMAVQMRFARFAEQLCLALGYMHEKGWLHHDLKPDNILFSKSSELKIIDFSLAMRRKGGLGNLVGGKVKVAQGTRTYIAPETIKKVYPSPQSDMYSFGVTLFEVLTGQPPFVGSTPNDLLTKHLAAKPPEPSAFNPNLTADCDKFILRLLSKKPAHRPKDMAEIGAELRSLNVFKRDPLELAAEEEEKLKAEGLGLSAKSRLDSRADAVRTAAGIEAPARPAARKPTAAALAAAKKHDLRVAANKGQQAPAPPPGGYPGYQPAYDWSQQYAAGPGYVQGYWPHYPQPAAPDPNQQNYYAYPQQQGYPQQGGAYPQQGGAYPQQPASPQHQPVAPQPQAAAAPPQQPPAAAASPPAQKAAAPQSPAARPAAQPPAAQRPAVPAGGYLPPGQGRGLDERHPTQHDVDPDEIPMMDELPEVL
jgi:serine/threonine-protein kinase